MRDADGNFLREALFIPCVKPKESSTNDWGGRIQGRCTEEKFMHENESCGHAEADEIILLSMP